MTSPRRRRTSAVDARSKLEAAQARADSLGDDDDEFDSPPQLSTVEDSDPEGFKEFVPPRESSSAHRPIELDPPPSSPAVRADAPDLPYGTGIEIEPDLHARVLKAAKGRGGVVRQTEVLLRAFEEMLPQIPELVAQYKNRDKVASPLFGTRDVRVARTHEAMKRLQVRPLQSQYQTLMTLADQQKVPLAVLTRVVLRAYFRMDERAPTKQTSTSSE